MAAIRSKDTKPEHVLRRALRATGLTGYRCHHRELAGKPDIAFTRWRVAVFVDGAFWHGHPDHFAFGSLGSYWDEKIRRTQQRDCDQEAALRAAGYQVLRFWDFEVESDPGGCAATVEAAVRSRQPDAAGGRSRAK